jgi:type VI secretion system secreted protein VgrG
MTEFSLESSALPRNTKVVAFRGTEGISFLYRFDVFALVPNDEGQVLDAADALGAKISLKIERDGGDPHTLHGVIGAVDFLSAEKDLSLHRLEIVPRLADLVHTRHSRIFTKKSIRDVIEAVLDDAGLAAADFDLQLGSYAPEEHICQFQESHYDFLSRWMEREGIYFFFDHAGEREKVVFADDKSAHQPSPEGSVRFHQLHGDDGFAGPSIHTFRAASSALPSRVKLVDYDYAKPALEIGGEESVADGGGGEVRLFGERFFTPAEGKRLAKLRKEEFIAGQTLFQGRGRLLGLRSGFTFTLEGHARSALDDTYLVTALEHRGTATTLSADDRALIGGDLPTGYVVELTAISSKVQFRGARKTPWPRVHGFQVGVVDAAADSDYADLDDQGRYAVKIHFDESDLKDGKASTRLRMMQPHGGNPEGFHLPLRKGTEVMIAFLAGDPDRPVVAGVVPNAVTPSPVTSKNHTRNIIHTGGDNHIELEDMADKQWIDIRTPPKDTFLHLGTPHDGDSHYIVKNTKGDCLFEIGSNQDVHVGGKLTEKVKGAVDETYSTSQTTKVEGPQDTTVTGAVAEYYKKRQHTDVSGKVTETYKAGQKSTLGGLKLEVYGDGQSTEVTSGCTEDYTTGPHVKFVSGATEQQHNGVLETTVTGSVVQNFGSNVEFDYGATTATWKSLVWTIPGGANINTSKWSVPVQNSAFTWLGITWAFAKKLDICGTLRAFTDIKVELTANNYAATALKDELTGVSLMVNGPVNERFLKKAELVAFAVHVAALKRWK